jgi:hypothetical protein
MIQTIIVVAQLQLSYDQIAESDTTDYGYEDMDANRKLNENAQSVTTSSDLRQGPQKVKAQRRGSAYGRLEADSKRCSSTRAGIQESNETDYGYGDADMPERPDKATPSIPTVDPKQAKVRDRRSALRRPQDVSVRKPRRRGSACGRIEVISETSSTDKIQGISQSNTRRRRSMPRFEHRSSRDLVKSRSFRDLANSGPTQAPEDKAARRDRWLIASQLAQDQVGESDKSVYGYEDMDAKILESDKPDYGYGDTILEPDTTDYGYGDTILEPDTTDYGYGDTCMPETSNIATPSMPTVNSKQAKGGERRIRRVSIGACASVKEIQNEFQKDPHVVAQSRRSDPEDPHSSGGIPRRPPWRANRRGSAYGRLQGGWDGGPDSVR